MPSDDDEYTPSDVEIGMALASSKFTPRQVSRWMAAHDARIGAKAAASGLRAWADGTERSFDEMPASVNAGVIAGMRGAVKSARRTADTITREDRP